MEIVESKATITDQKSAEIKDIPCFQKRMELGDLMQSEFNMGWVENEKATKGRKGVTKRKTAGSELGLSRPTQEEGARPKGIWARINRPVMGNEEIIEQKEGPKRKNKMQQTKEDMLQEKEKRVKIEQETKDFNLILATEFGSAEAVGQPYRVQ